MKTEARPFPVVITGHIDHGKSTLIGRLLHDTGSRQDVCVQNMLQNLADAGPSNAFAFVPDAFEEERLQGITIDTSHIYFRTEKRLPAFDSIGFMIRQTRMHSSRTPLI
jgi:sulfate adenylyltransferase subunit 1 (EFTu-like GTPase family)